SVTLTNDGSIAIAAIATAEGFSNLANARAIIQTGIEQDATAAGDALSATVVLTNTGTIDILAAASAIGGSTAWATASITSAGIDQSTEDAERAATSLTNSGTIGIVADAYASSTFFGPAIAVAVVESGIDQTASASAGD